MTPWIFAAFFLSGLAGLMHEIVWAKLLVQLIGTTAHAEAAVLSVYMGGLAIGAYGFGRWADRGGNALRTYVALEVAVGLYCLALPFFLEIAGYGYVALASVAFESTSLKLAMRFGLSISAILLPAIALGGTLPLMARHLIPRPGEARRPVATLYALNNLGAVAGAGIAGFLTLPLFGIYPSLGLAASMNFLAALLVWLPSRPTGGIDRSRPAGERSAQGSTTDPSYSTTTFRLTLIALAASGFAAMGYEVLFLRIIGISFGSSAYSFTVMLMCFIAGIGTGSAIISRLDIRRPLWWLAASQLLVVVSLLAATPMIERLPYWIGLVRDSLRETPAGFELAQAAKAAMILASLALPTIGLGFGFPLVAQIQARRGQVGTRVGSAYAWNTVGNVLGVLVTSLFLLPAFGLLAAMHINLTLHTAGAATLLVLAAEMKPRVRIRLAAGAGAAIALYLAFGTGWYDPIRYARHHLRSYADFQPRGSSGAHPLASFENWRRVFAPERQPGVPFFFDEDAHTTVLATGRDDVVSLFVNSKPDASTNAVGGDLRTQLLLAHAPLFTQTDAKQVLVIGYGSGITVGSALRHPIDRLDVVEISSSVMGADPLFADHNYQALSDPRVRVYVDDAQGFMRAVPRRYDVVISEPSNPWIAGVGSLFTVEFFRVVSKKLNTGGVFTLWFHQYEQSDEAIALILRSLGHVFPHVVLFESSGYGDVIAVASAQRIEPDFAAMEDRFDAPPIRNDLARIDMGNLLTLLSHHAVSQAGFATLSRSGPLNRATHQRLEYLAPRGFFRSEDSSFVQTLDPRQKNPTAANDLWMDAYLRYRARTVAVNPREIASAANAMLETGYYTAEIEQTFAARLAQASGSASPTRPAHDRRPPLAEVQRYEAEYWARRLREEGDSKTAYAYYARALELGMFRPGTAIAFAEALQSDDASARAVEVLESAVEHHPRHTDLMSELGWALIRTGDLERARAMHLEVLSLEPRVDSLGLLGSMSMREGETERGIDYFERAMEVDPSYWRAPYGLAEGLAAHDATRPRALQVLDDALANHPDNVELARLRDRVRVSLAE